MAKILISHRGSIESLKDKKEKMLLPANFPTASDKFPKLKKWVEKSKLIRVLEDNRQVVWVKKGKVSRWDWILTGMFGENAKAWVEFEYDENLIERPNGLKRFIAPFQWVITHPVPIPEDAVFHIPEK